MNQNIQSGSIVAYILIISMASLFIILGLLNQVSIAFTDSRERYHQKIADEAAESGIAYAQSCLEQNNRTKTWTTLEANERCDGATSAGTSRYIISVPGSVRTRFTVSNISLQPSGVTIPAQGIVEVLDASNNVVKTYTSTQIKTVVWDATALAQSSSSGTTRTCGILSGNAWCWGTNAYGQLGDNTQTDSGTPVRIVREPSPTGVGAQTFVQIASGHYSNCAVLASDEIWCWGNGLRGQMGNNQNIVNNTKPVQVSLPSGFVPKQIAAGRNTFCVLGNRPSLSYVGQVWCWGDDRVGQLGNGPANDGSYRSTPVQVAGPGLSPVPTGNDIGTNSVTSLNYGGAFSENFCAIVSGQLYCWGDNEVGQLGINNLIDQNVPKRVIQAAGMLQGKTVMKVAIEGHSVQPTPDEIETHTCALAYPTASGPTSARVYCWGDNQDNQLGNVATGVTDSRVPVLSAMDSGSALAALTTSPVITDLAVTGAGACVLAYPSSGTVDDTRTYCWGHRRARGDNDATFRTPLAKAVTDNSTNTYTAGRTTALTGGAYRACGIVNYRIYCWGANDQGQVGNPTVTDTNVYYAVEATFLRTPESKILY